MLFTHRPLVNVVPYKFCLYFTIAYRIDRIYYIVYLNRQWVNDQLTVEMYQDILKYKKISFIIVFGLWASYPPCYTAYSFLVTNANKDVLYSIEIWCKESPTYDRSILVYR